MPKSAKRSTQANMLISITRYREYSKKSFSRHNLERYNKAFNEFSKIYTENTVVKPPEYDDSADYG